MSSSRHLDVEGVQSAIRSDHSDAAEAVSVTSAELRFWQEASDLDELVALIDMLSNARQT